MSSNEIPFNMEYTFDKDLRDMPVDEDDMKKGVTYMITHLKDIKDPSSRGKLLGEIGVYSRILNELDVSEQYLKAALDVHRDLNNNESVFINQLRLAHTYQWQKQFGKAHQLFDELLKLLHYDSLYEPYKDFVYQHYGKCKFDEEEYESAYSLFQVALKIRKDKGDISLVNSTLVSIKRCKEILHLT